MGLPQASRPRSKAGDASETDLWSSLLDSVAGGKRLPEKHIILLGSSPSTQRDFIDVLANDNRKPQQRRPKHRAPIANEFALGYTYQDVLDADGEDILARLSIHTLPSAAPAFAPLLRPLLTAAAVPETLAVVLLDWAEPWHWIGQLRGWIQMLRDAERGADDAATAARERVMHEWAQKRRGGAFDMGTGPVNPDADVHVPLGPGEWDEPLGIPVCVVCHNSEKIDVLEREFSWREEEFDYLLQFLRTILLKHGASLVYTSNTVPNSVPLLLRASLGIHSALAREPLKHNIVDRDRILIPPNWDSWGKIRVLRDGFDVEGISSSWSEEISHPVPSDAKAPVLTQAPISAFNDVVRDPKGAVARDDEPASNGHLEVQTPPMQEFLARQLEVMEQLKAEEEAQKTKEGKDTAPDAAPVTSDGGRAQVDEQIGPVQFNMGGIQVDAEDVLRRIKENASDETPERRPPTAAGASAPSGGPAAKIDPSETQQLSNFFSSLIKRGTGTNPGTPQSKTS